MAKWNFPSLPDIGFQGFNTIGDQFKDKSVFHLAKEICQNSLDTMLSDYYEDNGEPIKIIFKEFWMDPKNIPGNESGELKRVFEEEYEFTNSFFKNDKTVVDFYKNAVDVISSNKIRCLRISDFNTPGLIGSDLGNDVSSPWNNLTKNVGVSDKGSASGGSKGVGKFVSFVCSNLYTVFYSTIAKDGQEASCGISRLSSYKKDDGEITMGEGYYDNNNYPLKNCISLDDGYDRKACGTDVYIVGFKNFTDWETTMTAAIIDSFFSAIVKGNLFVRIGDKYLLTKDTIDECINNEEIRKNLDDNTLAYYRIINSEQSIKMNYSMFEENDLELLLLKDDEDYGSINKVAAVRYTGMKILDISRLPRMGNYHGVLLMSGIKVNEYFRKLENATHSNWSNDRDVVDPAAAKLRIDELKNFVKSSIEKAFVKEALEEIDATGIDEVLPDEDEFDGDGDSNNEGMANDNVKVIKINEKITKAPEKQSRVIDGNEESDEVILDDDGNVVKDDPVPVTDGNSKGPNPSPLEDEEHNYSYVNRRMIPDKLRLISDEGMYKLLLKVKEDEPIVKLNFEIYGENSNEKFKPSQVTFFDELLDKEVKAEEHKGEYIIKDLYKNRDYTIYIVNNSDGEWPLEVKLYGVNK